VNKRVDFDDFTDNYNRLLSDRTRFFSSSETYFAKYKVDIVHQHVHSQVGRLLEYGCGIGRNIPFLKQAFPDAVIVGSDISRASLEIAKHDNIGIEFIHEDKNTASIGQFDLIFVAGVFHHVLIKQRVAVARTLFERLSPDGLLFIFEHNPFNPVTRRIVSNCPYDEDAVLLTPGELQDILGQAALSVERKAYCLFIPPSLSLLSRFESKIGWLPLGGQYWVQARRAG
jgi:SAM-dependent methyltransferase